jgi:hypothetical protein
MNGFKFGSKTLGISFLIGAALIGALAPNAAFAGKTKTYTAISISGTPATTDVAGTTYSFKPSTSGGSTTKSFSIANKPAWASFSISSGSLSGTPTTAQVGTYSNVTITVTDGTTTATLSPFSVAVTAPLTAPTVTTGSATLSWTAPTQNTDGSTMTDLAGYTVYYGTSPTTMTNKIVVNGTSATSYTVGSLSSGTYYFGLTAFNTSGVESSLSNIGSKTIN